MYDRAFTFQRVRKYNFVLEQLNKLELYEDNANLNLTNMEAINKFVKAGKEVQSALKSRYAEFFKDPATIDPRKGEKDNTDW